MACQLGVVSTILDVSSIRFRLFPEQVGAVENDNDWDGGVNWDWKDEDSNNDCIPKDMKSKQSRSWLQECVVSISPVGDVLVLARKRTIIWLIQKWDNDSSRQNFFFVHAEIITSSADIDRDQQDFISAVLCLPIASQKRSAHGRQDWTAVLVGFNLGAVRIYTEDGTLLLVQRFDQTPVVNIKCRCFEPPRYNAMAEQHEELVIVYKKSLVVVQGLGLYQTLRACRNQAAKAVAAGGDAFKAPPLEYKKWAFHDHDDVNDCESIGTIGATVFDRMVGESLLRYSNSTGSILISPRKTASTAASLFIATGTCPYVGFYYAVEGSAPLLVSEAMMAAAYKLTSYFSGFFIGGKPQEDKRQQPRMETATSLPSRFELRDIRRTGFTICASPNRRFSAITDEFGRVIIVDNHDGIAVRMFKGYREAQCGWMEVVEENKQDEKHLPSRVAVFLIIYSRRRGILEVWAAQQGPRVAAFSVGKTATLIYCNHSIFGITNVKSVLNAWSQSNRCFLIDVDGIIRTVAIPFHCALSLTGDQSKARDLHLLEKVRQEVNSWGHCRAEAQSGVANIVLDIKTSSVRMQALKLVLKSDDADSFVISELISRLILDQSQSSSENSKTFVSLQQYLQLLKLHDEVLRLNNKPTKVDNDNDEDLEEKPLQALSVMLHLSESEIDHLLTKVDRYFSVLDRRKRIRFKDTHGPLCPAAFISCFEVQEDSQEIKIKETDTSTVLPIYVASELPKKSFTNLSRFIFMPLLKGERSHSQHFLLALLESGVSRDQLLSLLIECWLNMDEGWSYWRSLCNLHAAVIFLSSQSADKRLVNAGYNEISEWWCSVRRHLRHSQSVAAALTVAIVCRGVSVTLVVSEQLEVLHSESALSSDISKDATEVQKVTVPVTVGNEICLSDWEGIHLDTEQWSLLVKQLEDLVSLATLVDTPIPESLSSGSLSAASNCHVAFTVDDFLERGRGAISELVSRWLTQLSLSILMVIINTEDASTIVEPQQERLKASFDEVRISFPYSLRRDILLANCSCEFAVLWNADKENMQLLDGCMSCLSSCSMDAPYRRGLASHLWHNFFAIPFMAAAQLVEKVGKAPKDRLCRKNTGMSDTALEKFLLFSENLLDTLVKVINLLPGATYDSNPALLTSDTSSLLPSRCFRCEDPWQDSKGPPPIVDIALESRESNEYLVKLHRDLAIVLYAVCTFALRSCKPLSLYDAHSRVLFFIDLYSHVVDETREITPDMSISTSRTQFLCRLLTAVVQTIPVDSLIDGVSSLQDHHANAIAWFGRSINLCSSWQLDSDQLKRYLVCELYSNGLDSMAEEVLPSVMNSEAMGSQLILIAGRRIYHALHKSSDTFAQKITIFSPSATTWLNSLERDGVTSLYIDSSRIAMTVPLLTYIVNAVPEHHSEHKLALNLMEGLQQLLIKRSSSFND